MSGETSFVWMVTVSDPEYWDYHGWEHTDAVGALFSTLEGAKKYIEEFYAEQYPNYPNSGELTAEQWADITGLVVNHT